jgi:hypothetical protein
LGGYVQYNIISEFGLQFNVSLQGASNRQIYKNYGDPPSYEKYLFRFFTFSLNGVLNFQRLKNTQCYLLTGAGISVSNLVGDWEPFYGTYFNFMGGMGIKIYLIHDSRSAINLGWTFHHLMEPKYSYSSAHDTNYFRFLIGLEFYPSLALLLSGEEP